MDIYIRSDKKGMKEFEDSYEYSYEELLTHLCKDEATKEELEQFASANNTYIDDANKALRYDGTCASEIQSALWYKEHGWDSEAYYVISGDFNGYTLCEDGVVIKNVKILKEFSTIEEAISFANSID